MKVRVRVRVDGQGQWSGSGSGLEATRKAYMAASPAPKSCSSAAGGASGERGEDQLWTRRRQRSAERTSHMPSTYVDGQRRRNRRRSRRLARAAKAVAGRPIARPHSPWASRAARSGQGAPLRSHHCTSRARALHRRGQHFGPCRRAHRVAQLLLDEPPQPRRGLGAVDGLGAQYEVEAALEARLSALSNTRSVEQRAEVRPVAAHEAHPATQHALPQAVEAERGCPRQGRNA